MRSTICARVKFLRRGGTVILTFPPRTLAINARRGVVKVANPVVVYIDQLAVVISKSCTDILFSDGGG